VLKAVATALIIGLVLAFPMAYLLDAEVQNRHVEAGMAIVEAVVIAVLVVAVRASRRA
jgi:hypothetical protein